MANMYQWSPCRVLILLPKWETLSTKVHAEIFVLSYALNSLSFFYFECWAIRMWCIVERKVRCLSWKLLLSWYGWVLQISHTSQKSQKFLRAIMWDQSLHLPNISHLSFPLQHLRGFRHSDTQTSALSLFLYNLSTNEQQKISSLNALKHNKMKFAQNSD